MNCATDKMVYLNTKINRKDIDLKEVDQKWMNALDLCSTLGNYIEFFKDVILDKKNSQQIIPESLNNQMRKLGEIALQENNSYLALIAFKELGDAQNVKVIGDRLLNENNLFDARVAFKFLNDTKNLLKIVHMAEKKSDENLNSCVIDYLGEEITNATYAGFTKWATNKGFNNAHYFNLGPISKMAVNVASNYDVGIGISRGGLFSTYIFNLFGLNVKVIDYHKDETSGCVWIDYVSKSLIENKKLLVIDNDVVTGKTTRVVFNELKKYNPASIDLALVHNPITKFGGSGTVHQNIPEEYGQVYYPKDFSYKQISKIRKVLEHKVVC
jgi:hypoxanthine phosphoribosyltransferase